ncbi:hypothetical protein CR513_14946, partial [Mucuna pruriens]
MLIMARDETYIEDIENYPGYIEGDELKALSGGNHGGHPIKCFDLKCMDSNTLLCKPWGTNQFLGCTICPPKFAFKAVAFTTTLFSRQCRTCVFPDIFK